MISDGIREYVEITCLVCDEPDLASHIHIQWNTRFSAKMGDARWIPQIHRGVIRLSAPLWPKASREEQVETIVHETCHIIAAYKFGPGQGHGPGWQQMMALCGYRNPRRCHTVDQANIAERRRQKAKRVVVSCGCPGGVSVGPVQAARIQRGHTYVCRMCKKRVVIGTNN